MPERSTSGAVSISTSAVTTSGCSAAKQIAFAPPIEWPTSVTERSPMCSISVSRSSTCVDRDDPELARQVDGALGPRLARLGVAVQHHDRVLRARVAPLAVVEVQAVRLDELVARLVGRGHRTRIPSDTAACPSDGAAP